MRTPPTATPSRLSAGLAFVRLLPLLIVPLLLLGGLWLVQPAAPARAQQFTDQQRALFAFDTRGDVETLADAVFGLGIRPDGWIGTVDVDAASFVGDLWFDNEQLANAVFGIEVRPTEWIGAPIANAVTIIRNVRHDAELTADEVFGLAIRPDTWRGSPVIFRCPRTLQNVVSALQTFYRFSINTPDSAINYCAAVQAELEDELINLLFGTPGRDGTLRDPIELLTSVRGDVERLADERLGLNTRPSGWIGNRDRTSTTLIGDLFLDVNLLADDQLPERPAGWIGVVTASPGLSALNLRRDLELLADTFYGLERPRGWQGIDPAGRCLPLVQTLKFVVEENYPVSFTDLDPAAPDYCDQLEQAVNAVVEVPPIIDTAEEEIRLNGSSNFAFAYLDIAASEYMGIMPGGVRFRAVYRNFGDSNMMFVSGDDFALYVDRRFTTVEETVFNSLPTLENVNPVTFCDAGWCNGPGPTPTPTGSGPLIAILIQTTPQSTPDPTVLETTKQLVSWNFIRVTYIQDDLGARTAQVALEICVQPAENATACEPVLSVFDRNSGTNRPAIGQFNGLNIYEFRYGYTTNVVIEGTTRFSNDIWISDPTIR